MCLQKHFFHVVVIDQSDACVQSLPGYLWVSKLGGNSTFKNAKTCPKIYPWGNAPPILVN